MALTNNKRKNQKEGLKPGGKQHWVITIGSRQNRVEYPVCCTELEAREMEHNLKLKAVAGRVDQKKITEVRAGAPMSKYVVEFLRCYGDEVRPSTLHVVTREFDHTLLPELGEIPLDAITTPVLLDLREKLLDKGLKKNTINKKFAYIGSLLKWAKKTGKILSMPCEIPYFPAKATTPPVQTPLTREQVNSLLPHIHPRFVLPFLAMADMGLRVHEALKLERRDVDLANGQLIIEGKGGKVRRIAYTTDRFWSAATAAYKAVETGPFVINPRTGAMYTQMKRPLESAAKKAGIGRHVNHHLLRKSFAAWLATEGVNPYALQKIMGHDDIETTMKIYTNIGLDFTADHIRGLRGQLNQTSENTEKKPAKTARVKKVVNTDTYSNEQKPSRTVRFLKRVK